MTFQVTKFLWCGSLFYFLSFIFGIASLLFAWQGKRSLFYVLLTLGFILQSLGLYYRGLELGTFPLTNTPEILHVISWCSICLVFTIQIFFRLKLLGLFGSGFASLLTIIAHFFKQESTLLQEANVLENPWIEFHALLAIFAYGTFALLAITAFMYLLQDYGLSHKHFGGLFGLLPSLKQMDDLSIKLLLVGFISLTLAVGIGTLTWLSFMGEVKISKLIISWGLWLGYFSILMIKIKNSWAPRHSSWACCILFLLAMISLWPVV